MKGLSQEQMKSSRAFIAFERIDTAVSKLVVVIEYGLGFAFIGAVALNFINVVDRYIFGHSIIGADEIQVYIMIWMTFLGAVIVTWRHQHLRMDVLLERLPQHIRVILTVCEVTLAATISVVMAWQSTKYTALMAAVDRRSDLAGIPMWIPHIAASIGFMMIAAMSLLRLARLILGRKIDPAAAPVVTI